MEIWKRILPEYEVSNFGNVRSVDRELNTSNKYGSCVKFFKGKSIKHSPNGNGYYRIYVKNRLEYIHILVAKAFIPNHDNKPQVNHKDGNKLNNHVSNLEWATSAENVIHSRVTGLNVTPTGSKHWSYRGKSPHAKVTLDLETGVFFDCLKEAIESTCVDITDSGVIYHMKKGTSRFVYA
jgi:hypothetical protein